ECDSSANQPFAVTTEAEELRTAASEALTRIERLELRRVQWGFVDGSLDRLQVLAEVRKVCSTDEQAAHVLEMLARSQSLFELNYRGGQRYRSRFAETVRLMAN